MYVFTIKNKDVNIFFMSRLLKIHLPEATTNVSIYLKPPLPCTPTEVRPRRFPLITPRAAMLPRMPRPLMNLPPLLAPLTPRRLLTPLPEGGKTEKHITKTLIVLNQL